ncbi:alpha-1,2-fucosyltransferase [Methylomonas sp. AM2-LC]|uniref:alpha-1,2-fucosyltransferase n=1 Tax=Methylomonas sp. AM2-LC TaxID=3153301 RepID=UPI003264EB8F
MIIVNLIGGLGNQMFQYAFCRALALELAEPTLLDISGFSSYTLHQGFELDRLFSCKIELATELDFKSVLGWQSPSRIRNILLHPYMSAFRKNNFVVEPYFQYWPEINSIPKKCYLSGYWQSFQYFQKYTTEIRADFTYKIPLVNKNAEFADQIKQVNAISLHVRRGDYVSNPATLKNHGVCSLDYYDLAIQYIANHVLDPVFFIFSDDIDWVKKNININYKTYYVDHNSGNDSFNDMRLMSLCKHHIIANSSFSWWGAWLNSNPNKLVIAPQKWFANNNDTKDLLPTDWIKL